MANNVNFGQFSTKLNDYANKVIADVKSAVEFHTGEIELNAIRDAPGGGDAIATQDGPVNERDIVRGRSWTPISQAIGYNITNNGLTGTVFVEKSAGDIAAWVEFSTGQTASTYLLTVPPEWRTVAQKFYINGKGRIIGRPYLLPNFLKQGIAFKKEIKEILNNNRI